MFRARANVTKLKSQLWKMRIPGVESPQCECGDDTETMSHILLDCSKYDSLRQTMIDNIELGFMKTGAPLHLRTITLNVLLSDNPEMGKEMSTIISNAVHDFIRKCPANI